MTEVAFQRLDEGLYITPDADPETAQFVYVDAWSTKDEIRLEDAWAYPGSGVFCFLPYLPPKADYQHFVKEISRGYIGLNSHFLLWISDPGKLDTIRLIKVSGSTEYRTQNQRDYYFRNSILRIPKFCKCDLNQGRNGLIITRAKNTPQLIRENDPASTNFPALNVAIESVELPLSVSAQGLLQFDLDLTEGDLDALDVGLRYFAGDADGNEGDRSQRYPVFHLTGDAKVPLRASLAPFDLNDVTRTCYAFRRGGDETVPALSSYFRTDLGQPVTLTPRVDASPSVPEGARLLFVNKPVQGEEFGEGGYESVYLMPAGEFTLGLGPTPAGRSNNADHPLLCGLLATETIAFEPGADTLRFIEGRPAYAPNFPFAAVSPVGPPVDPDARPLMDKYTTAWMGIRRTTADAGPGAGAREYSVQPQGASLYGKDALVHGHYPDLLGFCGSGIPLSAADEMVFPMVPYAGVVAGAAHSFDAPTLDQYESQVIGPARLGLIAEAQRASRNLTEAGVSRDTATAETRSCTTPSGLIVKIKPDGSWAEVKLAQNEAAGVEMKFTGLQPALQQAFQSNQLFLVIANADKLGELTSPDSGESPANAFYNTMYIGDWRLDVNVGQENTYGDYRNVLIFKFRTGALEDLVRNPELWTQRNEFGAPSDRSQPDKLPDPKELVIVSQWLQEYIDEAKRQEEDPYFAPFRRIIADPHWTGILALKVTVSQLPDQLSGLLGGIDRSRFYAHHWGVAMNTIDPQQVDQADDSATFGLISYLDPAYEPSAQPGPIPPETGETYEFKVLALRVLFENAAVKIFESTAQLTLNEIFAEPVSHMSDEVNLYNSILLKGSYQNQEGENLYVLDAVEDNTFYFDSNLLNKVEIVKARFSTVSETRERVTSRFSLWGFMDFKVVRQKTDDAESMVDLFSFGTPGNEKAHRQGLRFSGLAVDMTLDLEATEGDESRTLSFDASRIAFDIEQSTPREGSLYENLALTLDGLVQGDGGTRPDDLDYLPVQSDLPLSGAGDRWYGLRFRLNMGSPGELTGKVNLTSQLLLAWSPGSPADADSYPAAIGLKLPGTGGGASLLSLQGVMQLSIGGIRLLHLQGKDGQRGSFMMVLSEIALKFLGLLKLPPNGATAFYLFGNPRAGGKAGKLGWYAVYNQDQSKGANPMALPKNDNGEGAG